MKAAWEKMHGQPGSRLLGWGVFLLIAYAVLHLAGFRAYTDAISGMHGQSWRTLAGLLYMLNHLAVVFLAPPLLVAGSVVRWLLPTIK